MLLQPRQKAITKQNKKSIFSHFDSLISKDLECSIRLQILSHAASAGLQRAKGFPVRDPLSILGMLQSQHCVPEGINSAGEN